MPDNIGVDSANTALIKQYAAQNNYTLWRIDRTPSGNLTFKCKVSENASSVLTVPSSNSIGTNLNQVAYTDDTSYGDEWIVYKCNYIYYVNHYYDQGYVARFSSIDSNVEGLLETYQDDVAERFLHLFGIEVIPTYTQYSSPPDICKTSQFGGVYWDNLADACPHDPTHLTRTVVWQSLANGTELSTVVIWTGHILQNNPTSVSVSTNQVVMTPHHTTRSNDSFNNKSAEEVEKQSIYTLFHELSHQLGTDDHYCYAGEGQAACTSPTCDKCALGLMYIRSCLMGRRNTNLLYQPNSNILCNDCKNIIVQHINNHH